MTAAKPGVPPRIQIAHHGLYWIDSPVFQEEPEHGTVYVPLAEMEAAVARARAESRATAMEDAAKMIRTYPRATQDTMMANFERMAEAARKDA